MSKPFRNHGFLSIPSQISFESIESSQQQPSSRGSCCISAVTRRPGASSHADAAGEYMGIPFCACETSVEIRMQGGAPPSYKWFIIPLTMDI